MTLPTRRESHFVSVVVCTYNRVESLTRTLTALSNLHTPGFALELIVVDNNSSDGTPHLLAEYLVKEPRLRVLHETRQGKSYALNTGLDAARGDIIAFTDDDVRPAPDWLERMLAVYDQRGAGLVGGRVVLKGNLRLPAWLHSELVPFLGLKDLGDRLIAVSPPEALVGANMSVRKDIAERAGGFRTDLGPRGVDASVAYSEDNDFCIRISMLDNSGGVFYAPDVVTYHAMMPGKLTRSYFRKRALGEGRASARLEPVHSKLDLTRQTLLLIVHSAMLAAGWLRRFRQSDERFVREFRLIRAWSTLIARWRRAL